MTEHLGNFSEWTDEQLAEQERSFPSPHRIGGSMRAEMARREAVRRGHEATPRPNQECPKLGCRGRHSDCDRRVGTGDGSLMGKWQPPRGVPNVTFGSNREILALSRCLLVHANEQTLAAAAEIEARVGS
jgi:hypothetical protein